jgi:hypothetical protein
MILDAARSLGPPRRVVLQCHPAIVTTFVLLGAGEVPGVSLVTVHGR